MTLFRRRNLPALAVVSVIAVLVIAGTAGFLLRRGNRFLEIRDAASGKLYLRRSLKDTKEFAIEFIHSVHQSPVREVFTTEDDGTIRPLAVRFFSFGAGMQSDLAPGQTMSRDGDALVIAGFKTSYAKLNYIVGTVSDHLLLIQGETVSLRDLCGRNAHISIEIKRGFY